MTSDAQKGRAPSKDGAYSFVAMRALSEVADRRAMRLFEGEDSDRAAEALGVFRSLVCSRDYPGDDTALETLEQLGVPPEYTLDALIPMIAHALGEDWFEDRMSFAGVTIASARLQSIAWRLIRPFRDAADTAERATRTLAVIAKGEPHILGGVLAVGRFARLGVQVDTAFGVEPGDLEQVVGEREYDLVALSASQSGDPATLAAIIRVLKRIPGRPPIALGGSLTAAAPDDARAFGADIVTTDPEEALDGAKTQKYMHTQGRIEE